MACAVLSPAAGLAADGKSGGFAPPQQEGIADGFAEMEACSELAPELARPYADWIARNKLEAMMIELRTDPRYAPCKRAVVEHLESVGPRAEVVAACLKQFQLQAPKDVR